MRTLFYANYYTIETRNLITREYLVTVLKLNFILFYVPMILQKHV